MLRNCDVYTDVGSAMLAFYRKYPKYTKPDNRMAYTTPQFALCEFLLAKYDENKSNKVKTK